MRMPHSSVIPDYSGGFSELREVTDNIMDPSNPVDVGLMGLGMAPIPGARVPIGLRALSKAAQYILQNGLGKARRLFPKSAIDDAVVELGKRESQIITKANEANKGRKAGYMEDAQAARRNQGRTTRRGMRDKDPDYYLDDYPVEKPLGFAAGGMPRSPLMLEEPFIPQRPPRMFINDDRPRFELDLDLKDRMRDQILYKGGSEDFYKKNPPIMGFENLGGNLGRPPMQYIGEGAPRMEMPPEMPQFPGRQPKFPGMMQPIRQPEPVGPLPGMPPPFTPPPGPGTPPGPGLSIPPDIQPRGESLPQDHPFFQSPEYLNFQEKGGIGTMDMYQASDGTQFGSGTTGKMYERWLANQQNGTGTTTPPEPPMPPEVLNPDGTPTWVDPIETAPDGGPPGGPPIEPMPPDVFPGGPEQTAQPTQDQFMERLMQMIQALQERSQPVAQPAPQPVQQMPPPPPRPPATPFNMGNTGMSGGAPTMPQMFNQGPGFFTPQQRGPRIAPGAIAQQGQEMPNYNLDFSSFLRNR